MIINWLLKDWTTFGLGFMYTSVGDWRYHVWHPKFNTVGALDIHTHPWNFRSEILNGELRQTIYTRTLGVKYNERFATCADAECAITECKTNLAVLSESKYFPGSSYELHRDEIHSAIAMPYTVTRIKRTNDREECSAHFFWPEGTAFKVAEKQTKVNVKQHADLFERVLPSLLLMEN